ncbi:MAG: caspase family protein [Saprospiraceae bacterium]
MKNPFVFVQIPIGIYRLAVILIVLLFGLPAAEAQSGRKLALLIGIGNYPAAGGWLPINATNDLLVISDALRQRGFSDENIFIVKDEQATQAGIRNVWRTVFLPRVQRGDVVYFQFSGHGQQVADNNGNDDELDGYDEAIVPYDSPQRYQPGVYEGQNLIRDDELNDLFNDLRRRIGPSGNLMVVLDACHSGTGTRGMAPARGTDVAMASDGYKNQAASRTRDNFLAPQFGSAGASELAPMAAFFGSAHNQLNFEARDEQGQLLGSLSYALSKKFSQAPPNTTYRGLFDQVRLEMSTIAPNQQPQAEGSLDQELLGGRLLERPLYYAVARWNDPGSVVVRGGWVHGLNEGAVVGLYPAETRDPANAVPLAKGTVRRAQPFEATLELDNSLGEQSARSCWAYVLEQNFGDLRVGLAIRLPEGHPVRQELLNKTARYPMIRLDEAPEVFLTSNGNGVQLIGTGDALLEEIGNNMPPAVVAERLFRRILDYTQAKYIRKLDVQGNFLNVDFEIVPVRYNPNTLKVTEALSLDSKRDALGNVHFQGGDAFTIRVHNRGIKKAYFTLLDIQPDNTINLLIPEADEPSDEFQVEPGKMMAVDKVFTIGPPAGVEVFKLIATLKSVDLRPISKSRGAATRDVKEPLEQLFGQTFFNDEVKTRGGKTVNLAAGSLHVHSTTFIIDK